MKIDNPTDPYVKNFFGGDIVLNIPFLSGLVTPVSLLTWIVAIIAILPWVVSIVCVFVILLNTIKWVKSNGSEKEVESAKIGIRRAIIGFASMFILFILANVMSYFFIGTSFDRLSSALAPCRQAAFSDQYVFEFARKSNISLDDAYQLCSIDREYIPPRKIGGELNP